MITEKQLEVRRKGIGASEAGAILGVDKYRTPLDIYLQKINPESQQYYEQSEPAYWGNALEKIILEEYIKRTKANVFYDLETSFSKAHPFMLCHLDGLTDDGQCIVECKTASAYVASEWGDEGTDEIPDSYKIQVHHQMIVTGIYWADVPVLLGGNKFRIYTVQYDPELAKIIINKEKDFWNNHVLKEIPPEPITMSDIDTLFAIDDGSTTIADKIALDAYYERKALDIDIKLLNEAKEQANMAIKGAMGNASILTDEFGKPLATWKNQTTKLLNQKALKNEAPDLYDSFTTETESRVLRIKK